MKKLIIIALLFAACKTPNNNGTYVNHSEGQFSIADDTIIVADTVIINHTGFQKKRNDQLLPKALKVHKWTLNSPDAPAMTISNNQITIGQTVYHKLP
jgi:hypothetical protein